MVLTRAIASGGGSASTCSAVPIGSSASDGGGVSGTIIAFERGSIAHHVQTKRRDLSSSSPVCKKRKIEKNRKKEKKGVMKGIRVTHVLSGYFTKTIAVPNI